MIRVFKCAFRIADVRLPIVTIRVALTLVAMVLVLYRAANQRATIVYASPPVDAVADPALQREIRKLKSSLQQGIPAY